MDPGSPSWGEVFAHGIGGSKDLPIPLELTIAGAVAALTVSFTVLAVAWRTPRYDARPDRPPRARPGWSRSSSRAPWFVVLRAFGMLAFGYTVMVAVGGEDSLINPLFGIFYVLLWVGFVPALAAVRAGVQGDQPGAHHQRGVREAHRQRPRRRASSPTPSGSGYWPAALGLYAFVWMELVYPFATELGPGAAVVRGVRRGDAARRRAVRQHLLRARRPVRGLLDAGRRGCRCGAGAAKQLVVRSPLANLDTTPVRPGLVAVDGGAVRQHGVRLVQGLDAVGEVHPGRLRPGQRPDPAVQQPRACSASCSPWR